MAAPDAAASVSPANVLAKKHPLLRVFSFHVFLGGLLVAGVFVRARINLPDPDTWWHIAVGERILTTGTWPTSDPYSFTVAGNQWIAYEWLGEVVMALAARLGGLAGLTLLLILLSVTLFLLLYYYTHLRSGNVKAAFVACAAMLPLASVFLTLRPQLMGYIFLLVTLICLERFRQGRAKRLWALPALFLVWVNTHGTFSFGLMVLGVYWVSGLVDFCWGGLVGERWTPEQRRHLLQVALLCVLVLPLTPYGARLAAYPMEMAFFQYTSVANILEWLPLSFNLLIGKFFLAFLLFFLLAQVLFRPVYKLEELVLLFFAIYVACAHLRFLFFFVLVFAPLLATLFARWLRPYQPAKDRYVLNVVVLATIAGGMVGFFPSRQQLEEIVAEKFPSRAVEYLRQHPPAGPMLNEYGYGGYLIWALGPQHKVFIDGRADLYDYSGVFTDYLNIMNLHRNAVFLLHKYGVQGCLIQREAPLATLLAALPDWERVYTDEISALYVRKPGEGAAEWSDAGPATPQPLAQ